jgi:hypothetical protein
MRHRKAQATTLTLLTIVLALSSVSFKCGGCADNDPRCNYAKAADDIAGGISAMIDAKRQLASKGRITAEEESKLTDLLDTANNAAIAFNNRLKSIGPTDPISEATRADLTSLLSNVTTAISELNNNGLLRLGNADARQKLSKILGTVNAAVNILLQFRSQTTPAPAAPTPTPTP